MPSLAGVLPHLGAQCGWHGNPGQHATLDSNQGPCNQGPRSSVPIPIATSLGSFIPTFPMFFFLLLGLPLQLTLLSVAILLLLAPSLLQNRF